MYGSGATSTYKCIYINCKKSINTINGYEKFIIITNNNPTNIHPNTFTFCFVSTAACTTYRETVYNVYKGIVFELSASPLPSESTMLPGAKLTLNIISFNDVAS